MEDADEIRPQVMSQLAVLRDGFNQLQSRLAARVYQRDAMLVMSGVDSIKGRDRKTKNINALLTFFILLSASYRNC